MLRTHCTLRTGTKFRGVMPDGTLSAERQLTKDVEAEIVVLGPAYNIYDGTDGVTFAVEVQNEMR